MISEELFYVRRIASRLPLFKQRQKNHFSFRCVLCGDSKASEWKTRGSIYPRADHMVYGCFNCGVQMRFTTFLKSFDPNLYKEYLFDRFKGESASDEVKSQVSDPESSGDIPELLGLKKLFPVSASSTGVEYLKGRFVTDLRDVYYTNDSLEVIEKYKPDTKKMEHFKDRHAIVFPMMTVEKAVYGVQLRFLEGDFRYMTVLVDGRFAKIWGLHRVDLSKDIWVTEGVFDAYMLNNGIANLDSALHMVSAKCHLPKEQFVLVYDNEPRNREVMKLMWKGVANGYRTFFWPKEAKDHGKDLNAIREQSPKFFDAMVNRRDDHVLSGLRAELEFKKNFS